MSEMVQLESNKEVIRSFLAATDAQDCGAYVDLLAEDAVANFPGGLTLGRAEAEEAERAFATAFPDVAREIEDLIAEEDLVVARTSVRGTHRGEFQGIPATGRSMQTTAIVIYRLRDGRIAEYWVEADVVGLLAQLTAE